MKLNVARALNAAWSMWKTDWDLLVRVAGLFLFLPQFACDLLLPQMPALPDGDTSEAAVRAWVEAVSTWFGSYGPWVCGAEMLTLFGSLVMLSLYLGTNRPPLGAALVGSLRLFPRYLLAALIVSLPVGLFLVPGIGLVLVLPAMYLVGRLLLTAPVIAAEQPIGAVSALQRSARLTRGNGIVLMGVAGVLLFGGPIAAWPFAAAGRALGGAPMANPVTAVLLDGAAAAVLTAATIASVLVRVALYREALVLNREA